jgi:hypothetical protein
MGFEEGRLRAGPIRDKDRGTNSGPHLTYVLTVFTWLCIMASQLLVISIEMYLYSQ